MKILQKKICMIGDFGVGKTSLVARFVKNAFSDKYLTTVGVKMDTKLIEVNPEVKAKLILWDIAGDCVLNPKTKSYLRGTSGFIFVVDGTRINTLDNVYNLKEEVDALLGEIPFVILVNKHDLIEQWEIPNTIFKELKARGWNILHSSAKTGENVEAAFMQLAQEMVK